MESKIPDKERSEDIKYFTKNAVGITVVHLISFHNDNGKIQLNPTMDYHLHNLLYFDQELGHIGVLCLDTNELQTMSYASGNDMYYMFKTLVLEMTQFFVDKMDSMIKSDCFDENVLFDISERELWDIFNDIKRKTFVSKLSRFKGTVLQKAEPEIKKEPTTYKWSEIFLTEERLLPQHENARHSS